MWTSSGWSSDAADMDSEAGKKAKEELKNNRVPGNNAYQKLQQSISSVHKCLE
jgi:hypothetical protein